MIGEVTLAVTEYDQAIAWFAGALGFELVEDADASEGRRWVRVRPPGSGGTCLLLARAATPEQRARIGDQTGGRVALFLYNGASRRAASLSSKTPAMSLTAPWRCSRILGKPLGPAAAGGGALLRARCIFSPR